MRRIFATLVLVLLMTCQALYADDTVQFRINSSTYRPFGTASYVMEIFGYDSVMNFIQLKSELEFPLNAYMLGGEFELYKNKLNKGNWALTFGFFKNVNDPSGVFLDHDWYSGPTPVGQFDGKFSYTESDVKIDQTVFYLKGKKRIFGSNKSITYIYGGFRYQKIDYVALNVSGWQIDIFNDPLFEKTEFSITEHVLDYKVTYKAPFLGMQYEYFMNSTISAGLNVAYLLNYVSDYDDHPLRLKVATADGTGRGLISSANIRIIPKIGSNRSKIFFDLNGEFLTASASTLQTQEWYGDDPFQDGDETGLVVPNIPHDIKITQFNLGFSIGLTF